MRRLKLLASLLAVDAIALAVAFKYGHFPELLNEHATQQPDFWGSVIASVLAISIGVVSFRWSYRPPSDAATRRAHVLARLSAWLALSCGLTYLLFYPIVFYALLVGPTHAYALLGVHRLLRHHRRSDSANDSP